MKKIMALLTLCALGSFIVYAQGVKKKQTEQERPSEELKQEMEEAQESCDKAQNDPYEDLICERSDIKIRRNNKELEKRKSDMSEEFRD